MHSSGLPQNVWRERPYFAEVVHSEFVINSKDRCSLCSTFLSVNDRRRMPVASTTPRRANLCLGGLGLGLAFGLILARVRTTELVRPSLVDRVEVPLVEEDKEDNIVAEACDAVAGRHLEHPAKDVVDELPGSETAVLGG
jgi:hypothetical protein